MVLLTIANLFNYLDRMLLLALGPSLQKELGFNDLQMGLLATVFMVSYFGFAPVFGYLGDRFQRSVLMGFGIFVWSLATLASGWATSFESLLLARMFVGVGEAAYGTIGPAVLSDLYPEQRRPRVFAVFNMAIPVGSALGYLLGGALEGLVGWRLAFAVCAVPGFLLALLVSLRPDPKRGSQDRMEGMSGASEAQSGYWNVLKSLLKNPSYRFTVLGYTAYTFVMGGLAVWVPHYIVRSFDQSPAQGNMIFGGITVVAGFLGTIIGGRWAESVASRTADGYLRISSLSMFLTVPVFCLVLTTPNFVIFCCFVFVMEFLCFLSTSPINIQIIKSVPPAMRCSASAIAIFTIHLLGDGISPTIVGWAAESGMGLQNAMWIFALALLAAAVLWGWKVVFHCEYFPLKLALPRFQSHRGLADRMIQENTLGAFRAAKKKGFTMVELDVRLCGDGQVVVCHDSDTNRVAGNPLVVSNTKALDLEQKAAVPTLEKVLLDKDCADLLVNIEIKSESAKTDGIERAVSEVVSKCRAGARVLVSSFNPLVLWRLKKIAPDIGRALLVTQENDPKNRIYLRKMWLQFLAEPNLLHLEKDMVLSMTREGRSYGGIPIVAWTIESPAEARRLLEAGAVSVIMNGEHLSEL